MRFLPALTAVVLLGSAPLPVALAFGSRDVPLNFAQRGVDVKVTPEGCSIDFGSESIAAITISDRRQILVRKMGNSSVYLQRIKRQNIEGMLGMPDGTAVLRVWTISGKRLSFRLTLGNSGGKDISIVPATANYAARPIRPALPPPISFAPKVYQPVSPLPVPTSAPAPASVTLMPSSNPYPLLAPVPVSFNQPSVADTLFRKSARRNKKDALKLTKKVTERKTDIEKPINPLTLPSEPSFVIPSSPFSEVKPPEPLWQSKSQAKSTEPAQPQMKVAAVQKVRPYSLALNQAQAGAILKGLNTARLKKGKEKIAFLSPAWNKTQGVIRILKRGKPLDTAITKTRSDRALIERLMKEGGLAE